MLELKAAPSQNPVLPAANAANATAAAGEGADAASLPHPGQSFAAVLKQHIGQGQGTDKKTAASAADALLALAAEAAPAEAPADPIALLAPMLPGITVPQAVDAEVSDTLPVAVDAPADTAAVVIAAPVAAALPTTTSAAAVDRAPGETARGTVVDNLPREGEKTLPGTANIAAQAATTKEPAETQGRGTQGFEAAFDVAKEAQMLANPHAPVRAPQAAAPAPASTPVATPVGAPGWDNEVGDKIVWMANRQESRAELVLNPPQLGRVEVSLTMNGDQANATFISANASVREALENAMPRLREVLQGAGISLGQTQVGAESFQQAAQQQQTGDNPGRGRADADDAPHGLALGHEHAPGQMLKRGNGLVDTFA